MASAMRTVYFDLETGGVNDEPTIQLAAVAIGDDWSEIGSFEKRLKFDPAKCSPEALKVNRYDPELWKDAVEPTAAARMLSTWAKEHSTVSPPTPLMAPPLISDMSASSAASKGVLAVL